MCIRDRSWTPDKATPFIGTHDEVAYDQFVLAANKGYRAPEIKFADKVKIDIDPATGALRSSIYNCLLYTSERIFEGAGELEMYQKMRLRGTEFLKKAFEVNNGHGIIQESVANNRCV